MIIVWYPDVIDPGPERRLWRFPYRDHSSSLNRAITSDHVDPSQPPIMNAASGVDAVAYRTIRLNIFIIIHTKGLCLRNTIPCIWVIGSIIPLIVFKIINFRFNIACTWTPIRPGSQGRITIFCQFKSKIMVTLCWGDRFKVFPVEP